MSDSNLGQVTWRENNKMYSIKNIGRVAGFLYIFIDIFGPLSILYVPTNSSHAATAWLAISAVVEVLVDRIEVLGGIWVLLVTWAALLSGRLPRALNYLGLGIGVAGVLTVVPAFGMLGIGFMLGEIVWGVWLGIVMLRGSRSVAARKLHAFFVARLRALVSVPRKETAGALNELIDAGEVGEVGEVAPITHLTYPLAQPLRLSMMSESGAFME